MSNAELTPGKTQELITEVPVSVKRHMGEAADKLGFLDPNDAVANIQRQLANRPANAGRPEIRAGDVDSGHITQRGEY